MKRKRKSQYASLLWFTHNQVFLFDVQRSTSGGSTSMYTALVKAIALPAVYRAYLDFPAFVHARYIRRGFCISVSAFITSSIHPGQPCLPCALCKANSLSKYFQIMERQKFVQNLRKCDPSIDVQLLATNSCICRDDVRRFCDELGGKDCNNGKCYIH